jgi:hypothetical protein
MGNVIPSHARPSELLQNQAPLPLKWCPVRSTQERQATTGHKLPLPSLVQSYTKTPQFSLHILPPPRTPTCAMATADIAMQKGRIKPHFEGKHRCLP